jgi:hypothetical protein
MRKISSATAFNIILNEAIAGGLPRPDGRPGCMIAVRPGINMIPDDLEHWYLQSHIDAGSVTSPDVDGPPRAVSKYLREQPIEPPPTELIGADLLPTQERKAHEQRSTFRPLQDR